MGPQSGRTVEQKTSAKLGKELPPLSSKRYKAFTTSCMSLAQCPEGQIQGTWKTRVAGNPLENGILLAF